MTVHQKVDETESVIDLLRVGDATGQTDYLPPDGIRWQRGRNAKIFGKTTIKVQTTETDSQRFAIDSSSN